MIIERWNGPISVGVVAKEEELQLLSVELKKSQYQNITFVLYVTLPLQESSPYSIARYPTQIMTRSIPINALNFIRDLAIEVIQTTHFFFCDVDLMPSSIYHLFFSW